MEVGIRKKENAVTARSSALKNVLTVLAVAITIFNVYTTRAYCATTSACTSEGRRQKAEEITNSQLQIPDAQFPILCRIPELTDLLRFWASNSATG
jgi:hypothetical protein